MRALFAVIVSVALGGCTFVFSQDNARPSSSGSSGGESTGSSASSTSSTSSSSTGGSGTSEGSGSGTSTASTGGSSTSGTGSTSGSTSSTTGSPIGSSDSGSSGGGPTSSSGSGTSSGSTGSSGGTTAGSGCTWTSQAQQAVNSLATSHPNQLVTGDFDGLPGADLAILSGSTVSVLSASGRSFNTLGGPNPASQYTKLAAGNVDGTGHDDLILLAATPPTAKVFLNQGGGSWSAPLVAACTDGNAAVAATTFLGPDNKRQVAVAYSDGQVCTFEYDDSGSAATMVALANISGFGQPNDIRAGDLGSGGDKDLVVSSSFANQGHVLLSGSNTPTTVPFGFKSSGLAIGDFNGDGAMDVAAAAITSASSFQPAYSINSGGGVFESSQSFPGGPNPDEGSIASGDLDKDGIWDVAVGDTLGINVYWSYNNSEQHFQFINGVQPASSVVIADFDGDGTLDIAFGSAADNQVNVIYGQCQ